MNGRTPTLLLIAILVTLILIWLKQPAIPANPTDSFNYMEDFLEEIRRETSGGNNDRH